MSVRSVAALARSSEVAPVIRARSALQLTQSFFFASLGLCLLVAHGHTAETDGISYYGVHPPTMPALFAGYLVGAAGLWWSASQLVAAGAPGWTLWALRYIAVGLVVLLATPYNQGAFFNWAHVSVGVSMGLAQVALVWALLARRPSPGVITCASLMLFGGLLSAISLPDWQIALNIQGETLLEAGFAWCLIEWTHALKPGARTAAS